MDVRRRFQTCIDCSELTRGVRSGARGAAIFNSAIVSVCATLFLSLLYSPLARAAVKDEAQLEVQIGAEKSCRQGPAVLWVAQDRNLIYQIEVPTQSNARVHLVPGKYRVVVNNEARCFANQEVELKNDEHAKLELVLSNEKRKPAYHELAGSGCMCITSPCPCNQNPFPTPNYIPQPWYPWWGYYGSYYPQFYYPSPWMNWGMNPGYYPGQGHVGLAKPNVYVESAKKSKATLRVEFDTKGSNWLATVPSYTSRGWEFEVDKNKPLQVGGQSYPYLFYDLRVPDSTLQDKNGFCLQRNEALQEMSRQLTQLGFKKSEVSDFERYWRIKMPPGELCVFPQLNAELDPVAKLVSEPEPHQVTRVVFMVIQKDKMALKKVGKFIGLPQGGYLLPKAAPRSTASAPSGITIREWGVAFAFEPSK